MILVVDGNNLLHRAHWVGQKNPLINSKQVNVTDIFHVMRMVKSYVEQFQATEIYMVWDQNLVWPSTNFRKQATQIHQTDSNTEENLAYKGNRVHSDDVFQQMKNIWDILATLGVRHIFPGVMEADDVIAWLSIEGLKDSSLPITIVSNDKDLLQLINERTHIYNPLKKEVVTLENFEQVAGIRKELFIDYKCMMGDPSDNIKGVRGFGPKKAANILLEGKLDTLNEEQKAVLEGNRKLINLSEGYKVHDGEVSLYEKQLVNFKSLVVSHQGFLNLCTEFEFPSVLNEIESWIASFSGQFAPKRILRIKNNP